MALFGLDHLREIMIAAGGADDGVDLGGDIATAEFADLGFDSLAMLEIQARVKQVLGISFPDDATLLRRPADLLDYVNKSVVEV
jgi:act minimal PKS acyl carrier protein